MVVASYPLRAKRARAASRTALRELWPPGRRPIFFRDRGGLDWARGGMPIKVCADRSGSQCLVDIVDINLR
jgi:hypothetical protein